MSEHYYSPHPSAKHDLREVELMLNGRALKFQTDSGVFAKREVDFGSRLLIKTMIIPKAAQVLDVGCGYGPIGLAAAALASEGMVTLLDINPRAIELAQRNARINQLNNVRVMLSDLYKQVKDEKFTHILTNPPIRAGKETVHAIFSGAWERLDEDGELWVVIQKKQGAPSALTKLESLFTRVDEITKAKGYRIFRAQKFR